MAYDKVIDSSALDANLASIAEAIRTNGGTTDQLVFPAGFISAIEAIEAGGGFEISTGIITPSEAVSSLSWEHGLSKAPSFVIVFLTAGYSVTTYANISRMYYKRKGYSSSSPASARNDCFVTYDSTSNFKHPSSRASTDIPFEIDDTTVTAGECKFEGSTVKKWVSGNPYLWICISGDVIFPYK